MFFSVNADEVHTLTNTETTYKATVKSDTVFYNIVGKTSPTRTNLIGWLNLKTNLITQGFTFSRDNTITDKVRPWSGVPVDNMSERSLQARQSFNSLMAQQAAARKAAAEKAFQQKLLTDPKMREAAKAAADRRDEDERVSQGLQAIKEGRNVRIP